MATHSSFLAWRIPWTEKPDRLQSMGLQKSGTWFSTWTTNNSSLNMFLVLFLLLTWPETVFNNPPLFSLPDDNLPCHLPHQISRTSRPLQGRSSIWTQSLIRCPIPPVWVSPSESLGQLVSLYVFPFHSASSLGLFLKLTSLWHPPPVLTIILCLWGTKYNMVCIPGESGLLLRAEEVSLLALPWVHFLVRTIYGWVVWGAWLCNASKCWSEDGLGIPGRSQPSFLSAEIWGLGEWGNYGQECHQGCCRQAEVGPHSFPQPWQHKNLSAFTAIWAEGRAECLTALPSGKCPVPHRCGIPHHSGLRELSEDLLRLLSPHRTNPRGRWSEAWEGWWREFTLPPCVILCDLLLCLEQLFFRDVQRKQQVYS